MKNFRIIFASSSAIALPTLEVLWQTCTIVAIVTQPDRPQGRGLKMHATPIDEFAQRHGIKVFKPEKVQTIQQDLANLEFDLFLTFAYGQLVPETILSLGNYRPLNIHASLLPKYRGAAPIQYAILNGDSTYGISLIEMVKAMDAGPIYFQEAITLNQDYDYETSCVEIASLAAKLISPWLAKIANHAVSPTPQGQDYCLSPKISNEFARLDLQMSCQAMRRKILALAPHPGAYLFHHDKRLKIFNASLTPVRGALEIPCVDGKIFAFDYQFAGKNRVKLGKI